MAIKQDVNAPLIVTIGVVSATLLLIAVFGVQAWFFHEEETTLDEKWDLAPNVALIDMKADQNKQIETAGTNRNERQGARSRSKWRCRRLWIWAANFLRPSLRNRRIEFHV